MFSARMASSSPTWNATKSNVVFGSSVPSLAVPTPASQAVPRPGAGAPGDVEVTPAMLEAGIEAVWAHDLEHDLSREIVSHVFQAMARAGNGPSREASWLEE